MWTNRRVWTSRDLEAPETREVSGVCANLRGWAANGAQRAAEVQSRPPGIRAWIWDDPRQGGGTGVVNGSVPGGRTEPVRRTGLSYCIPMRQCCAQLRQQLSAKFR